MFNVRLYIAGFVKSLCVKSKTLIMKMSFQPIVFLIAVSAMHFSKAEFQSKFSQTVIVRMSLLIY